MTYSQARQDLFVLHMMGGKAGKYLEIGASHPVSINNTYLLEQNGWQGISVDLDSSNVEEWKRTRKNTLLITDALTINEISTERIDYLQLDIDPPEQTMQCLINLMATGSRFSIITFEHDAYTGSPVREFSRELLQNNGYQLAVADVACEFGSFEDWWIDTTSDIDLKLLNTWKKT